MPEATLPKVRILDPDFQHDPVEALAEYRRHQPVFQPDDMPVFILTRYQDVAEIKDMSTYSTMLIRELRKDIDGPSMIQMDGEEHRRNRSLVSHAWRPKVIRELVHRSVPGVVDDLLSKLRPKGRAEFMKEFCEPLPFLTIIVELLGMHVDNQPEMSLLYRDLVSADPVQFTPERHQISLNAREEMLKLLRPVLADRRANPTDDFLSQLITARAPNGDRLSEDEIEGFLLFLFPAGQDTTMSALGTLLYRILREPGLRDRLINEPKLITAAIEESVRLRPPIPYLNRVTLRDLTLHGVEIPTGSLILGSLVAANRDETVFENPDEFVLDRDPNPHLAWGTGAHMCIGAPLARLEIEVALPLILEGLPNLRLAPGFEPRYVNLFNNMLEELPLEWDP